MTTIKPDAAGIITLPPGATAEPNTCGSCKFFRRCLDQGIYEASSGHCEIVMPPPKQRYRVLTYEETGEVDRAPNWIKDSARCDFYRPDGRKYIVQREVWRDGCYICGRKEPTMLRAADRLYCSEHAGARP